MAFFKNPYQQITLPTEVIERMTEVKKLLYFITVLGGLVYTAMLYGVVHTAEVNKDFPIIYAFHELWLYTFPLAFVILLLNRNHLFYRTSYFRFTSTIVALIFLLTILFLATSVVFITKPSAILVYGIYLGHIALFVFYFTKYIKLWNRVFSGEEGRRYAQQIEQYGWREDILHQEINAPKDKNETANRPFYTKVFEKVGNFLVASVFILPTLFAMSATGTGGGIPIYFAEIFIFLIAPFIYNLIAKGVAWYLFIKHLEKEKNVIIYNGIWDA